MYGGTGRNHKTVAGSQNHCQCKESISNAVMSATTEKQQLVLQHRLSSIDTIVNFWTPPKSQGGQLRKKYFGWHK